MTAAELNDWQRRCGLRNDRDAAKVLRMAVSTYRAKRKGRSAVSPQDELLCAYYEILALNWLGISDAALKIGRLTHIPIAPAAARQTAAILAKVLDFSGFRQ